MENMELICLQIISNAGEARSESMAALTAARNGRFDEAEEHLAAAGEKMKAAAEAQDFACEITAAPVSDAEAVGTEADLILLGPQVRFQMETVKKQVTCPVTSIDPVSYGTMNGEKVLNQVKKELGEA